MDWSKLEMDWSMMIPVEGTVCCAVSALFCVAVVHMERKAKELESVTRVNKLKDLAQLCSARSTKDPFLVVVSGRVRSDTPIECKYSSLRGVIVEKKEEQHILRRNFRGEWKKESIPHSSKWKEVPWYLDDGTGRARVLGARSACTISFARLPTNGGEVFEKSTQSPYQEKLELGKGIMTVGVQKMESVLPAGRYLTIVGLTFGLIGTILIAKHAFQYRNYKAMQKREAELSRQLLDAGAAKQL